MSMISGLIDELNKSADEWNGSNMFELARMCREAADTICELQTENAKLRDGANAMRQLYEDELKHALAENAKLRESVKRLMTQRDERLARAETDNAKLRELVADAWGYISHPANATWTHEKRKEVRHSLSDRMRELGVEVDA